MTTEKKNIFVELKEKASGKLAELKDKAFPRLSELKDKTGSMLKAWKENAALRFAELKSRTVSWFTAMKEKLSVTFGRWKSNTSQSFSRLKEKSSCKSRELREKWSVRRKELGDQYRTRKGRLSEKLRDLSSRSAVRLREFAGKSSVKLKELREKSSAGFSKFRNSSSVKLKAFRAAFSVKFKELGTATSAKLEKLKPKLQQLKDETVKKLKALGAGAAEKFRDLKQKTPGSLRKLRDGCRTKFTALKTKIREGMDRRKTGSHESLKEAEHNAALKLGDLKNRVTAKLDSTLDEAEKLEEEDEASGKEHGTEEKQHSQLPAASSMQSSAEQPEQKGSLQATENEAEDNSDADMIRADRRKLDELAKSLKKKNNTANIARTPEESGGVTDRTIVYDPKAAETEPKPEEHRTKAFDFSAVREALEREQRKNEKKKPEAAAEPADRTKEEEEYEYTERDFTLIRRNRRYRTGLLGGLLYFLFVVCVSVALAGCCWLAADDVLSLSKDYAEADVYVGEEMDMDDITTELYSKGMIKYRKLFKLFAKVSNAYEKIQPGTYHLSTKLDYRALVQNMKTSTAWSVAERSTVTLMIPEGKTMKQTFQILADHGVCPYETLVEYAAECSLEAYDFLPDELPEGENRLEGYLFPDTYEFYADSEPEEVLAKFLNNFESKLNSVIEMVENSRYSLEEIITIASLIEMEAANDAERGLVSSVIYNRLASYDYPYLQIDATIQYALEERKEYLSDQDLRIESPYNSYTNKGLPPGPITNPGLASIRGALNPESTNYYFYALSTDGIHKFFSTYDDFLNFKNSSGFGG